MFFISCRLFIHLVKEEMHTGIQLCNEQITSISTKSNIFYFSSVSLRMLCVSNSHLIIQATWQQPSLCYCVRRTDLEWFDKLLYSLELFHQVLHCMILSDKIDF